MTAVVIVARRLADQRYAATLNAQGLSKRFGAVPLFQDISFPVSDGDRIGLIGPNGAGSRLRWLCWRRAGAG